MGNHDIFDTALLGIIMNTIILIGLVFVAAAGGADQDTLINQLSLDLGIQEARYENTDICRPGDTECTPGLATGESEDPSIFDKAGALLRVGQSLGKAIALVGASAFIPFIMQTQLAPYIGNSIIGIIVTAFVTIWQIIIAIHLWNFATNFRGQKSDTF